MPTSKQALLVNILRRLPTHDQQRVRRALEKDPELDQLFQSYLATLLTLSETDLKNPKVLQKAQIELLKLAIHETKS